jgi:hypothetical protein
MTKFKKNVGWENITQKRKEWAPRTPLKPRGEEFSEIKKPGVNSSLKYKNRGWTVLWNIKTGGEQFSEI